MPGLARWLRRTEIKAIHGEQLEAVLRQAGLWEPLMAGRLVCNFCGATIDQASIGCIVKKEGVFHACCSGLSCYMAARGEEVGGIG